MTAATDDGRRAPGRLAGVPVPPGPGSRTDDIRLDVSDLEIRAGRSGPVVVSEISFAVRAGEILGLVGESGSGKTTVALALLGYARRGLSITSGAIRLDGVDLLALRPARLREMRGARVSYVPQDPSAALNPALRIGTQLREALRVHHVEDAEARLAEVMQEAYLDPTPEMLRRYPHQLSGGQQQRVALAMAFACRPSLIVMDEPTTGLDVSTQRHVLETVRNLSHSYGVAAVYVSHDLAVVSELVAEVAVMYAGRIVEMGSAPAFFGSPLHPYSRGLLAAVPTPERAELLTGIDGQQPGPGHRGPGCAFAPRCGLAIDECRSHAPGPVLVAGRTIRCHRAGEGTSAAASPRVPVATASGPGAAALSVRALSARYGEATALSGIEFDVPPETCVAVVGESGSGKTTLARCISGLHENWTGQITFESTALSAGARRRSREELKRIQYVFQNPYTALNPRKTIGQTIAQPLAQLTECPAAERSERVVRVLEDVSLSSAFMSRYPDQLSGGERQRVAIARALIVEPDLLICDEVTSALDVSVQAIIVELLRSIQRERQLAMIFITHNLALVRSIAQQAIVLRSGQLVEAGTTDQILEHPSSPYTASLIADIPRLASQDGASGRPG